MESMLLDAVGHRRSPATMPGVDRRIDDGAGLESGEEQVARRGGPDTCFPNDTQLSGLPAALLQPSP